MRDENVVGERVLIAVQAVNVSRLSTHPVPLVPGTLVVVAGAGPKDSNGAGKSSFIAAITALLGDEQWRFATGAGAVGELLFNAELAAAGGHNWSSAGHGYIAGVFGGTGTGSSGVDVSDAVTVWVRVNAEAPHLQIRWADGVRLANAGSEAERVASADRLWESLPRSAGRRDVVARDLVQVLYGERVRCVSFLSTSVRSKVATNLLSQPLNEISPERIFAAIAALTGLDAELGQEREARRDEHDKRTKAAHAATRLEAFEGESRSLLDTFARRDAARTRLADARRSWRTRLAQRLIDASARDDALAGELAVARGQAAEAAEALHAVAEEINALQDETLDRALAAARSNGEALKAQAESLAADRAVAASRIDEHRARIGPLEEAARRSDGRSTAEAEAELAHARQILADAHGTLGVATAAVADAEKAITSAEGGHGAAESQINVLTDAGIPVAALLDAVDLTPEARDRFEPALWPYRDAVVVAREHADAAARALAGLPGSVIIPADGEVTGTEPAPGLPDGVRTRLPLTGFLDNVTSLPDVIVVGGFPAPITGREARVAQAVQRLEDARERRQAAKDAVGTGEAAIGRAEDRLAGARAGEELERVHERIAALRAELSEITEAEGSLAPGLTEAEARVRDAEFRVQGRSGEIEKIEIRRAQLEETRDQARGLAGRIAEQRAALNIDGLAGEWDGTPEAAREWLLALTDEERRMTSEEWWRAAERHLEEALRGTFPERADDPDMPEELRFLVRRRDEPGPGRTEREQSTFASVASALAAWLGQQEEYEGHQRRQIEAQLASRHADLTAAQRGADEATTLASVHRAQLTTAIKARVDRVSEEFERLDLAYGGYGAVLDCPVPEPPADPEQPWQWRVTPKWRRGDAQPYVPYTRRANTALMDEKAVKLVCAAAIASSSGGHLFLVLDELGRNLGKEHRREAVALFRRIGEEHGITVVGALQDDMEPYAIDACGQYIKLRRSSDAMPYNEPPVIIGQDEHDERVTLLSKWITESRP